MTIGFKIQKKGFKFCRRDRFGTRPYPGGRVMVKPSPLGGELILRTEMRSIKADYYTIEGICEWDSYKQHLPSITAHFAAIDAALERYKARRIERGLVYLVPMANSISFWILSPLDAPPSARREALEKWRRQRKKRKAASAAALLKKPRDGEMTKRPMKLCTAWYLAYIVSVAVLSCAIVFL